MTTDNKWPTAAELLTHDLSPIGLIDIPAHETSISKTNAWQTPAAIRESLNRYSSHSMDSGQLQFIQDLGAIQDPDKNEAHAIEELRAVQNKLLVALGGDNSITYAVAMARLKNLQNSGVITLDAHHDLREGVSNGSPIRRLIDSGVDPKNIVQIGINSFSNSTYYSNLAKDYGITVISRDEIASTGIELACEKALKQLIHCSEIHVDLDVDVCDRSAVPACPASAPGGISAYELRIAARKLIQNPKVVSCDITEIDASQDSADGRTVRLGALLVLEAVAGFGLRGD